MDDIELKKALGEYKMSIFPRKYHGPELKCGGPGMCPDCTDKQKKGLPWDYTGGPPTLEKQEDQKETPKAASEQKCSCSARELFWHGCRCGVGVPKKNGVSIKF